MKFTPAVRRRVFVSYHKAFEAGDAAALLKALTFSVEQDTRAPRWVGDAFMQAMNRWYRCDVGSLDDAFGMSTPSKSQLEKVRRRWQLQTVVMHLVDGAREVGVAIDDELFEAIAMRIKEGTGIKIGRTLVKEYLARDRGFLDNSRALAVARKLIEEDTKAREKAIESGK